MCCVPLRTPDPMTSPSERSQIRPEGTQTGADASALSSRQFPSLLALPEKPGTSQGRPEGGHTFLHSEHHGEDAARAVVTLIILPPLLVFYVWLTLCCADFLSLERSSFEADSAWQIFALHVALGCLLPPALIAGFTSLHTHDGHEPAPLDLLREGLRATLLCYGLFVVLFFSAAWMLGHFLPTFHPLYVPMLLDYVQAPLCCLLLWVSWSIAAFLLPPVTRRMPPRSVSVFFVLAWTLALLGLFSSPLSPYADGSGTPGGALAHPLDFFLLAASSWLLFRRGLKSMRIIFTVLCLTGPLGGLAWLPPDLPAEDAVFALCRAVLAFAACLCLWLPSARSWLAD